MTLSGTLILDIETHSAEHLYTMPPDEFVRLIGYRWVGRETVLTVDLEEIQDQIGQAAFIIGHNIHSFDLPAIFGIDSDEPLELAMQRRVYDTWTHAILVNPMPFVPFTDRHGVQRFPTKKDGGADLSVARLWFSLDEQAYQLGVPGKTDDFKALAAEFGDPRLLRQARISDGTGKIPISDPRYRAYLRGDIAASEAVAAALLRRGPLDGYAMREQEIAARAAVIQANGFRVDQRRAEARINELRQRREVIMVGLAARYGMPTEGKAPWSTTAGKSAIMKALADQGITPETRPNWQRLKTGMTLSGDTLIEITKDTPAAEMGQALAELKGQRSLAQLALDSMHSDGFTHPSITMLQRSGRWSTTDPGLTIWTARGPGAVEKAVFLPDNDDEVLIELDLSNADQRVLAAYSGDTDYAVRFEPGQDGHLINAWAAWGKDVVGTDKKDPTTARYRQMAKPLGHGWGYGGQAKTLSREAGVPLADAERFCQGMERAFRKLVGWQNQVRGYARARHYVVNAWGRRMPVQYGKEFTQAPALLGQNGTRELVCDGLLALSPAALRRVKGQIHDALVVSVPRANWTEWRDYFIGRMRSTFHPPGGIPIEIPVDCGPPGSTWYEASH